MNLSHVKETKSRETQIQINEINNSISYSNSVSILLRMFDVGALGIIVNNG